VHPPSSSTSIFSTYNRAYATRVVNQSSIDAQFKHHKESIAAKTPGEAWKAFLVYLASYRRLDLAFALLDDLEHYDQATPSVYLAFLNACSREVHREADIRAQETITRMQARGLGRPPSFSFSTKQLSTRSRSSLYPWLYTHTRHAHDTRHTTHHRTGRVALHGVACRGHQSSPNQGRVPGHDGRRYAHIGALGCITSVSCAAHARAHA